MAARRKILEDFRDSFERLVIEHRSEVRRLASCLVGNFVNDVEDVVVLTFLKAWETCLRREELPRYPKAYFTACAKAAWGDHYRRQHYAKERPATDSELVGADYRTLILKHEEERVSPETVAQLTEALHYIPENYAMPVVLVDLEGMSYWEAAQVLEVPLGTVRSRLNRARKLIRAYLKATSQAA